VPLPCALLALVLAPTLSGQGAVPRFADYPAAKKFTGKPAAPVLSSAKARRYRTIIWRDAATGPNFAGHYTVADWGCGSTCVGFAVVDARTGKVYFHPEVSRAMQVPYQAENVLQYRLDSRLLVIAGESERPQGKVSVGKFYYEWKEEQFSLIGKSEIQLETGAPPLPPGMELDDLCSGIDNSLECAQEIERYQLQKGENARRVKRQGVQLLLKLDDGSWLIVKDDVDPDDKTSTIRYSFRDHLLKIGYFLLHRQLHEGRDYLMIHERTGRRYELHDVPAISPDKQRLVTASNGVTGGYSPNAVQIWRLTGNGLELEQTLELQGWGPSGPKWLDNDTIRLTKNYPVAAQGDPRTASVTLKRNGKWRLQ